MLRDRPACHARFFAFFRGQVLLVGLPPSFESALGESKLARRHRFTGLPDGETAWQWAIVTPPDVVLSRWALPDMSAAVLCQRFKANLHHSHLRNVRFIAAVEPAQTQMRSMMADIGLDDVLDWPLEPSLAAIRLQIALTAAAQNQRLQKVSGQLRLTQNLLAQFQGYDPTVGCFTRTALSLALEDLLPKSTPEHPIALLLLAIDRLEEVASTHGPEIAEAALVAVVGRLQNQAAPHSLVYLFERPVVACLLPYQPRPAVVEFAKELGQAVQGSPVAVNGLQLKLTLAIGIGWGTTARPQDLLFAAKQSLTQAQAQGAGTIDYR
ncbi:MAG: diguanylate cyclase [Oscillatoriales cyanobacterium SM2_1_8]|nr:diguanylate cyclase [Oscillatoriales cyanobacterium SM2_1_8]